MREVIGVVEGGVFTNLRDGWSRPYTVVCLACGHMMLTSPSQCRPVRRRCWDCPPEQP
jgi:hypothetical protein